MKFHSDQSLQRTMCRKTSVFELVNVQIKVSELENGVHVFFIFQNFCTDVNHPKKECS